MRFDTKNFLYHGTEFSRALVGCCVATDIAGIVGRGPALTRD
jgi:hypothetical protein